MSHVTAFSTPTSLHPSSSPFSDHYHQTSPMHILTLHQYQYDMGSVIDWRRKTIKFFKKNLCTDHLMNQHQLSLHTYHAVHLLRYEPCIISFFFFFLFKNDSLLLSIFPHAPMPPIKPIWWQSVWCEVALLAYQFVTHVPYLPYMLYLTPGYKFASSK